MASDREAELEAALRKFEKYVDTWLLDEDHVAKHVPVEWRDAVVAMRAALKPRPAQPARLDPDGTATGKTILTAHVQPGGDDRTRTLVHPPGDTHVDLETGKRTPLR